MAVALAEVVIPCFLDLAAPVLDNGAELGQYPGRKAMIIRYVYLRLKPEFGIRSVLGDMNVERLARITFV
jgi:hypothetical protein